MGIGVLITLYARYPWTERFGSIHSLTFWLMIAVGPILFLFLSWVLDGKYKRRENSEIIHGIVWGSCLGFLLWITEIFFAPSVLALLACLSGGALAGIVYFIAKSGRME
jgi:hypothetical protein